MCCYIAPWKDTMSGTVLFCFNFISVYPTLPPTFFLLYSLGHLPLLFSFYFTVIQLDL
jgi:hypothetical protein